MASLIDVDAFIKELSKHIGIDWKALARELGLSKTDIDAIEYDNHLSMKDQIFGFFFKWKQQEGRNASAQKLIDGMKAANLEEQLKKMQEAGLMPDSQLQYIREQRLKRLSSDPSSTLSGSPRETTRTLNTGSTTSGDGEQECPPTLLTMEGDLSTATDGNTKLPADRPFEVGDLVKVEHKDSPWYGVIHWIGQLPGSSKRVAGIEMDDEVEGGHSGEFQGEQYFRCSPGHGLFLPVDRLKRDDRFDEDDVETDETKRLSRGLPKSPERDTLHQQPQASPDERYLQSQSHESTLQGCSLVNKAERLQSAESTLDALKELEAARLSSSPGKPETSSEDSSGKPFKGLIFCIPGDQTGMVIGKEGKNIRQVESETNTIIKVVERSEQAQLSRNATVAIIGSEENCRRALYIILGNLRRKIFQHLATTETITIPNHLVGRVIGKGGSTCNAIEKLSGARVKVENREDLGLESLLDDSRICKITGMAEHIEEAKELIKRAMLGADIVQEATFAAVMVKLIKLFREMGFEFQDKIPDLALKDPKVTHLTERSALQMEALKVQLEKALKRGYILTDLTMCLATGAPGSGKTHLRYLLYGLIPPNVRISTACVEEAQRAVIGELDSEDPKEGKWKLVDSGELKEMVAEWVSAGVEGIDDPTSSLTPHQPSTKQLGEDITSQFRDTAMPIAEATTDKPEQRVKTKPTHTSTPELPETADILKLMKTMSASKQTLRAHWMHFIDSGGQPQFLEILPAFIHKISLLLLLVKLSERLSDFPTVEYFTRDGKSLELGTFPFSNEQLLLQAAQLSLFHHSQVSLPHVEADLSQPNFMVVGTFEDQESKCKETRSEKNTRLKQLLKPFEKRLIPRSEFEIIFPVNAKSAGQGINEDPVATELRRIIQELAPRLRMRFPIQWHFLEMELRRLGLKIVTKSKCWAIARKLEFESKDALEAALLYLHEVNLFLYYPDVLSDTIFVDPQVVFGIITQLYGRHVKLEDSPESEIKSNDNLRYRDQALFTTNILTSLNTIYDKAIFSDNDLIKLLQYRLVVAKMSFSIDGKASYMMPSLLPTLEEGESIEQSTLAASPLFVTFPEGWAPTGLFCALVVSLLSRRAPQTWHLTEFASSNVSKLYKNRLQFSIDFNPGSITLVNTKKQFELHPSSTFPSDLLPMIWQTIDQDLKEVCSKYSYKALHHFAFECDCGVSPSHAALVSADKSTIQCTQDPNELQLISSRQKLWVLLQSDYAGSDMVIKHQQIQTEVAETVDRHVQAGSTAKQQGYLRGVDVTDQISITYNGLSQSLEWLKRGFKMHFPENALPPGIDNCQVLIKASFSGQFNFPRDTELISGIYWISSQHAFTRPVTVEIQHCVQKDIYRPSSLTYIVAKCSQKNLPYQFKTLDGGVFSPSSQYGSINLTRFSALAISSHQTHVRSYCARLYYNSSGIHSWDVYFAIMWNLELHITAIDAKYTEAAAVPGPDQEVIFEGEEITLDIPKEGISLENGWTIIPYTHPGIKKCQVDHYVPGSRVPSCQLYAKWTGKQGQPVELTHRVELLGARNPYSYFLIRPPTLQSPLQALPELVPRSSGSAKQSLGNKYTGQESEPELSDLLDEVASKVPSKWKQISIQLGLTPEDQECFMASSSNDSIQCFTSVFKVWKCRATKPYKWSTVIQALKAPSVGEVRLAKELTTKLTLH